MAERGGRRRFGTIRKLPSGRFQARYPDSGGRHHPAPATFERRSAAETLLNAVETDQARGVWTDPSKGATPFPRLVAAWRESRPSLRSTTVHTYAYLLRSLLLPFFGEMGAASITPAVIRHWHTWASQQPKRPRGHAPNAQPARPLSANTVSKAYRLLRAVLDVAVDDGVIARNPCKLRGVASERPVEQRAATAEEVERLASVIDPRFRALVLLATYSGLRWGELVGLRKHRVNGLQGTLRVAEQVTQPDGGDFVVGPPKTTAGSRTVTIPEEVLRALEIHMSEYSEPGKEGLVFPAPEGGYLRRSNFRKRTWLPALRLAGIEHLRFHDLRHTHGTLAANMGIDTATLMNRMGHASPRAALIYQHGQSDGPVADALDEVIATARASLDQSDTGSSGTRMARRHLRAAE